MSPHLQNFSFSTSSVFGCRESEGQSKVFFFFFCQGRNELLSVGEGGKGRGVIIRADSVRRDHEKLQDTSRTSRGMTVGVYVECFLS